MIMSFNMLTGEDYQLATWLESLISVFYFPLLFSYMPCVFLYIKLATEKDKTLTRKALLHTSPSLLLIIISITSYLLDKNVLTDYAQTVVATYYITALGYLTAMALLIKPMYVSKPSAISANQRLLKKWLTAFVGTLTSIMVIFLVSFVISLLYENSNNSLPSYLLSLGFAVLFVFANGVLFFMLREPKILSVEIESVEKEKVLKLPKAVNRQSGEKLISLMNDELLFLDPLLCLNDIAEKMELHTRTTSMLLKYIIKQNFNDFVNTFRVDTAKDKIEHYGEEKTLTEVQFESGFNSKSVFNSAFKKHTGMTPTQYRNSKMLKVVSV